MKKTKRQKKQVERREWEFDLIVLVTRKLGIHIVPHLKDLHLCQLVRNGIFDGYIVIISSILSKLSIFRVVITLFSHIFYFKEDEEEEDDDEEEKREQYEYHQNHMYFFVSGSHIK